MKKGILFASMLLAVLTISCVRHSCEYGQHARIVVLQEPYTAQCWENKKNYKINAHVFMDNYGNQPLKITGTIPSEYKTGDTLNVRILLKEVPYYEGYLTYVPEYGTDVDPNGASFFYRIYCIERDN